MGKAQRAISRTCISLLACCLLLHVSCMQEVALEQGFGRLVESRESPEQTAWDVFQLYEGGAALVERGLDGEQTGRLLQVAQTGEAELELSLQTPRELVVARLDTSMNVIGEVPYVEDTAGIESLANVLSQTFGDGTNGCSTCSAGVWGIAVLVGLAITASYALVRSINARRDCTQYNAQEHTFLLCEIECTIGESLCASGCASERSPATECLRTCGATHQECSRACDAPLPPEVAAAFRSATNCRQQNVDRCASAPDYHECLIRACPAPGCR